MDLEDKARVATYVVQMCAPFSMVCRLTAGHENVAVGPRVCETTGCKLDSCIQKKMRITVVQAEKTHVEDVNTVSLHGDGGIAL